MPKRFDSGRTSLEFYFCPFFFFFFFFLQVHLQHMEVSRLGVESEQQLPGYPTATATLNLSCIHSLYHSLQQCGILNPLSEARDQTHILMDSSWVLNTLSHSGNSNFCPFLILWFYVACSHIKFLDYKKGKKDTLQVY